MSSEDERTEPGAATEVAPASAAEDELARLHSQLDAAKKQAEEFLDRARRAQADYENFRKRTARELEELQETANEGLLAALLPVLDDFDRSLAVLPPESAAGFRMLHEKLWRVLRDAGLEPVSPAGQPFDPYDHEVVGQANDEDLTDGTVKEVVQTGYRYRRRLLRPAKVIVVKRGE